MTSFIYSNSVLQTKKSEFSLINPVSQKNESGSTFNSTLPFFSSVKKSDLYLKAAIEEGFIDHSGTFIDPKIDDSKPASPLEKIECYNIKYSLDTTVQITKPTKALPTKNPTVDLSVSTSISKLLSNIRHSLETQNFSVVEEIKLVGGVVPHCLRGQFLERWMIGLFGQHLGKIPTLELLNRNVCKQMESPLNDIDSRIVLKNVKNTLKNLREDLLKTLSNECFVNSTSREMAEFLHSLHEEYSHITPSSKGLVGKILKAAYLLKSYASPNPLSKDQLAIVSFGDRTAMVFEILLQINLERPCLFRRDSLRINIKKFLEDGDLSSLGLESDFQINQVFSDWNGQVIHVPHPALSDEDDWPALMSRMVAKGDRCLVPGTEKKLFDVFVEKAQENKKELSKYILECFSKRITNHHYGDGAASLALPFQICSSMRKCGAPSATISAVWKGLTKPLEDKNSTLLHQIASALENSKISFEDVEACIALGSFDCLNTAQETEESPVLLTQHEGTAVEITIEENNKFYHLWHRFDPQSALEHILKKSSIPAELQTILEKFSSWASKKPVSRSPYKDDLSKQFNMEAFSGKVNSLLNNNEPSLASLGMSLYLACQALQPIPPVLLLEKLPQVLINLKKKESRLHLLEKISNIYPEQLAPFLSGLKKIFDTETFDESLFREQWILSATSTQDNLLKNSALDLAINDKEAYMHYFKKLLPAKAGFAISLVKKANEKKTQPPENIFKAIGGICCLYPKYEVRTDTDQDVESLYILTMSVLFDPQLQLSQVLGNKSSVLGNRKLFTDAFSWLIQELSIRNKIDKSTELLLALCKKGIILPTSSQAAEHTIKFIDYYAKAKNIQMIEKVLYNAGQIKINWKSASDKLPTETWIFLAQCLYDVKSPISEDLADQCCSLFLYSKDERALSLLTLYFKRHIEVQDETLEKIILTSRITQEEKLYFKIKLLELHIKKNNFAKVKEILLELSHKDLDSKTLQDIHELVNHYTTNIHRVYSTNPDAAIVECASVIIDERFLSLFKNNPQRLSEILLFAYSKISKEKFSHHYENIALSYCFLLLDYTIETFDHTKPTAEALFHCLAECLPMAVRSSHSNSQKLLRKWSEKQLLFFKLLKSHELISQRCKLLSILLTENFSMNQFSDTDLLSIVHQVLTTNETTTQNISLAIWTFDQLLKHFKISNENVSKWIEIGQIIISYNVDVAESLSKKLIESNIRDVSLFHNFFQALYKELDKKNKINQCFNLLLICKKYGFSDIATQFEAEKLSLRFLEQKSKATKKTIDSSPILELVIEFSLANRKLYNVILENIPTREINTTYLKKIWCLFVNEATHKNIFIDDNDRFQHWVAVLKILDKQGCNEPADLEFNPTLQELVSNCKTHHFKELQLLRCYGLMRRLKTESNEELRSDILKKLAEACKTIFINDIYAVENDTHNPIQLDIANVLLSEVNYMNFNLGMWLLLSHLELLVPTGIGAASNAKTSSLPLSKTKKYFSTFLLLLENFSKVFPNPGFREINGVISISNKIIQLKIDSIDLGVIIQKLTAIDRSDVLLASADWANLALDLPIKSYKFITKNNESHCVFDSPRTTPNDKDVFGQSVVDLVTHLLKRSRALTNPEEKTNFLDKAFDLFNSTELPKYLPSSDKVEILSILYDDFLDILEIYLTSQKDVFNIDQKADFAKYLFELPIKNLLSNPDISKKLIIRTFNCYCLMFCHLNESKDHHIYQILINGSTKFNRLFTEQSKNHKHLKNFQEYLALETKHSLELINEHPENLGSKILLKIAINGFAEMCYFVPQIISDEIMDKITLTIITHGFESDKWIFKLISICGKEQNLTPDLIAEDFSKVKLSAKTHENLILLDLNHLPTLDWDLEIKQKTITSLLLKLLDQPPTGHLITSLCDLAVFAVQSDIFPSVENAFGENIELDHLYQKFMDLIPIVSKLGYRVFNDQVPLLRLKQMIMCPHPFYPNDMYIFGIKHKQKSTELIIRLIEALIDLGISKEIPINDPRRLQMFSNAHALLINALGFGLLNDHVKEFFILSEILLSTNIFDYPFTDPHFEMFINTWCASTTIYITEIPSKDIVLRQINQHLMQLVRLPNDYLTYAPNDPLKTVKAIKICELLINKFSLNFFHSLSFEVDINQRNIKVMEKALNYMYFILAENFDKNLFNSFYKSYLNLCKKNAEAFMSLLNTVESNNTLALHTMTDFFPVELTNAKILARHIFVLFLNEPPGMNIKEQSLRDEYLNEFLELLKKNHLDLYQSLLNEFQEKFQFNSHLK